MTEGAIRALVGRFRPVIFALPLMAAACISPVDYGPIRHADYVANGRCDPVENSAATNDPDTAEKPFFVVTSRLPDCRADDIKLLNHRGDKVRFGRFGAPQDMLDEKGKVDGRRIPFSISNETQWWASLSKTMGNREGRVLLYVHGYRETFFTSSRDTAQIARLTNFTGPVIQYSWPSQGQFLKYTVDETNMYWDERNFRKFLTKLAQQPWTKEIVLVSHSLGARLILPAVEFVDRNSSDADSSNISNIILVSPDVDRQDFERDIAEEILSARRVNNDRRITVYASAKDSALSLSDDVHGYPRLGNPRCFDPFKAAELKDKGLPERCYAAKSQYDDPPEKSGLTIVDTTAVSQGRVGHGDYLRSAIACRDFAAVVNGERGAIKGRDPTHLSYVFALAPPLEDEELDDLAICRRDSD
ncbi:alpha/beta hydrolase [Parasphingorhabdus cellanae]|uniref:Alpha/beta hydrolase n=1 Tax=Parasphingorhabdus cellanae TaxID=2806553 RepID=A0ABX7TA32_9SPHN|nr:alpha/beta hydrolase [Parasphingorhabdus cellanae]QTD57255.1 alpha/beta hydrolase [Parasphingorhabdus cellanae]